MSPFECLLVATVLAITVGSVGTVICNYYRKQVQQLDEKSTQ